MQINHRKTFIINPKFQYSFISYICGGTFIAIAIFYASNVYFFSQLRALGESIKLPANHVYFQFINNQITTSNIVFAVTAIVVFSVLFFLGYFVSNKIAGPIYRICKEVRSMNETGKIVEISTRKGDYFPELKDAFNEVLSKIK